MEAGPARLAAYVRRHAPHAGYDLGAWGEQSRLARDADMDTGTLARLLRGERVPLPKALWPLAQALSKRTSPTTAQQDARHCYTEMLVAGGIIPAESVTRQPVDLAPAQPITADDLAAQWGVTDPDGRKLVSDMLARLRMLAQHPAPDQPDHTGPEAHN